MGTIFNPLHSAGPPAIPPAAHPAVLGSATSALAGQNAKAAAGAAEGQGFDNTIQTTPKGLEAPSTAKATLLG